MQLLMESIARLNMLSNARRLGSTIVQGSLAGSTMMFKTRGDLPAEEVLALVKTGIGSNSSPIHDFYRRRAMEVS